jgi:hypothetical protein
MGSPGQGVLSLLIAQACMPVLEHDPEKWKPVFRKDHAQTKDNARA